MINVNEYFDGKVKSLSLNSAEGPATLGVMKPGDYEFGTSTVEYMTVVSGRMEVLLPGESEWKTFEPYATFRVEKDVRFQVKVKSDTAYLCHYQ